MPEPIQNRRSVSELMSLLAAYGHRFDGTQWLMIEEVVSPNSEVSFFAAVTPEAVAGSGNAFGIQFQLIGTEAGNVLETKLTLPEDPVAPMSCINCSIRPRTGFAPGCASRGLRPNGY